jgi:hypothetical protein
MYLVRSGVFVMVYAPACGRVLRPDAEDIDAATQKCKPSFCTAAFSAAKDFAPGFVVSDQAAGSAVT